MSASEKHPQISSASSQEKQPLVRNAETKAQKQPYKIRSAFRFAGEGIGYTFTHERNMRVHVLAAFLAVCSGLLLHLTPIELALVVFCIAAVFASECFNTAIEALVDLVSPTYSDLAKHAKDAAAGAVLVCAIGAVIIACLIYVPAILRLLS